MQSEQKKPRGKKRGRKKKRISPWSKRNPTREFATIGRELLINGKEVRAYTRAKLVEAFAMAGIPKTILTIRNWEKWGILPRSPIVVGGKYYYTERMIRTIVLTYIETGQGVYVTSPELLRDELWKRLDAVVREELF